MDKKPWKEKSFNKWKRDKRSMIRLQEIQVAHVELELHLAKKTALSVQHNNM